MNGKKTPIVRINPHDDIDSWVTSFNLELSKTIINPEKEVCVESNQFSDWRLSYGVVRSDQDTPQLYFLAFYPPFCTMAKARFHYHNVSQLAKEVLILENFLVNVDREKFPEVDAQDVIACAFAILRQKESIELFQEQKDLMEFGLQHYHLDNYYQDLIRMLVAEYQLSGTLMNKKFHIGLFDSVGVAFDSDSSKHEEPDGK